MGFLDHSTNNIIVDAVLTDVGRKILAQFDDTFSITDFALGDDEIDYGIITKYGRTIGQEKIEKNTPVMEALTRSNLGLKYRLVSIADEYVTHFPLLELNSGGSNYNLTTGIVTLTQIGGGNEVANLQFLLSPTNTTVIPSALKDSSFLVEVSNIFLSITNNSGGTSPIMINTDNTSVYSLGASADGNNMSLSFSINLTGFSSTQFNTYKSAGTDYVRTYVKITGEKSGLTKNLEVRIKQS